MILDILSKLKQFHIVLASASPRRVELLRQIGLLDIQVVPSTFAENLDKTSMTAAEYCRATAERKGEEVFQRLQHEGEAKRPLLVISADTVIELPGVGILEKPRDRAHAVEMLGQLSGRCHTVHTGVALFVQHRAAGALTFTSSSQVSFAHLPPSLVEAYVSSGEPSDKAGGYGIQGMGGAFVQEMRGEYGTVVGLPVHATAMALRTIASESQT